MHYWCNFFRTTLPSPSMRGIRLQRGMEKTEFAYGTKYAEPLVIPSWNDLENCVDGRATMQDTSVIPIIESNLWSNMLYRSNATS